MRTIKTKPVKKSSPARLKKISKRFIIKSVRSAKRRIQPEKKQGDTPDSDAQNKGEELLRDSAASSSRVAVRGIDATQRGIRLLERGVKIRAVKKQAAAEKAYRAVNPHAYQAGKRRVQMQAITRRRKTDAMRCSVAMRRGGSAQSTARPGAASPTALQPKSVKPTGRTIKAAKRTVKVKAHSIKTASAITRMGGRMAQAAAKSAIAVKKKTALHIAKTAGRAIVSAVKAILAAMKALITLAASGGSLLLIIAVVVCLVVMIFGSAFGIFFSNEADGGKLTAAVIETQTEYSAAIQAEIDVLSSAGTYDSVEVHYDGDFDGDSNSVNNWSDVLAVFAVRMMSQDEEVLTMTPEKVAALQAVFYDMNLVDITSEVETIEHEDEEGSTYTTSHLHIYVAITSLDYLESAALYDFTEDMLEVLEEMMSPAYYAYFAEILHVDLFGGLTGTDITDIVSNLPAGTKGGEIAQRAIERVGTPYSKLDCSKLVQSVYSEVGISLPRTSVAQSQYCYNNGYAIGASELQPGDLIFWSKTTCQCGRWNEIHHVGIYIGSGQIVDASSGKGRVVLRDIWQGGGFQIFMYARAHV